MDAVLCTQVLQYLGQPIQAVAEMHRVLRPGGLAVISMPFCYNEHAVLDDYWRCSAAGLRAWFREWEVVEVRRQGGVGGVMALLTLNWVEELLTGTGVGRALRALLLPVWVGVGAAVNLLGAALDAMDRTGRFYVNVLVVARRR